MTGNRFDTIIIGSGLSGLLCGYILAREGMKVCILEKELRPGGSLQTFRRKGVEFNTGMHYTGALGEGEVMNRYFRYFGLAGKLNLRRLDRDGFDIIGFRDGDYPLAQGFDNFVQSLLPHFPGQEQALEKYVNALKEIGNAFPLFNLELPSGIQKEEIYRSQSASRFFDEIAAVRKPETGNLTPLAAVLAGNNFLYAGLREKTPLHIPALINHSFISSAWKLEGGSGQVTALLLGSIQSFGGEIRTGSEVCHVTHANPGFTIECRNGELFSASRIISSAHPFLTLGWFDPGTFRKAYSSRIRAMENTTGAFTLYAVLKENAFPAMNHNYYYHDSHDVWHKPGNPDWPQSYLLYTSGTGEIGTFAKSMVIMTFMDYTSVAAWENSATGSRDTGYYEFKERMAGKLLTLVEKRFPAIRNAIACTETSTPLTWRDYTGTPGGSMYGILKDFHEPEATTLLPRTKIPGLFLTGQNINLHGMTGVTTGAVMTCSEILGYDHLVKKIRNG